MKQRCRSITTVAFSSLTIARLLWKDLRVGRLLFITTRQPILDITCSWKIVSKLPLLAVGTKKALTCRREYHRPARNSLLFRWTAEKMRVHALKLRWSFVLLSSYTKVGEPNTFHLYSEMRVIPVLSCTGQSSIELSRTKAVCMKHRSPLQCIWSLRDKFCKYLSITLLSAAVFNWWRSSTLTCTGNSGTQKSKPCLFLPLLRDFLYGQGHTAVHHLFPCAKSAGSAPIGIPRALQAHL